GSRAGSCGSRCARRMRRRPGQPPTRGGRASRFNRTDASLAVASDAPPRAEGRSPSPESWSRRAKDLTPARRGQQPRVIHVMHRGAAAISLTAGRFADRFRCFMVDTLDVALAVNGRPVRRRVRADQRLLDLLRDDLRLTGAKEGCGKGECGACTVIMDGRAVDACLVLAYQADGAVLETIEGLGEGGRLHPLQDSFIEAGATQCGICIPGMIL